METEVEISSTQGLTARFIPLGATLTSLFLKDRDGKLIDVVLGFDSIEGYKADTAYMGRTVGRVCNRIRDGLFVFDGREYQMPINCGPHHLHGGPSGIAMKEWEIVRHTPTSVTFRMWANEESDGFPGDAKIDVTYTVNDRNELVVAHGANSISSPGVLNLTNHSYWNLDGSASIKGHILHVDADAYLPTDADDFPTGKIAPVAGTRYDFLIGKPLYKLVDDDGVVDIDHDMVLRPGRSRDCRALSLYSSVSGIQMEVTTSYPVIHIYGGRHLICTGKNGEEYGPCKGLAIEAQFHTGALNYQNFSCIRLSPDRPYYHEIIYSFSVVSESD